MVFRRFVSGILRKAGVILVPLYENKKSLGMPDLGFLRVTWPATTSHPWLDAALFCHPWQNITVCRQAYQDFLIFSQSHKISSGFAQDASLQVMKHHLGGRFISKSGARVWIFDICTNGNMLKILMCCIIDIQLNDFPEFPSATLYYMKFFVNCQTNNAEYFFKCVWQ